MKVSWLMYDLQSPRPLLKEHVRIIGSFDAAAALCPKVLKQDSKAWEDWIFTFVQRSQLGVSKKLANNH